MRARAIADDDRDAVLALLGALAADRPTPWFIGTPAQQLDLHDHAVVLEADGGCVVGCALLEALAVGVGWVRGVWVQEAHRRRGGASALMRASEAWLRSKGCHRAKVAVVEGNQGAAALYESLGYRWAAPAPEGGAGLLQRHLG